MHNYKINRNETLVSQTHSSKEHEAVLAKKGNAITKEFVPNSPRLAFKSYYNPLEAAFYIKSNKSNYFDLQILCTSGRMHAAIFQAHEQVEIDLKEYTNGIYHAVIMENGKVLDTKTIFHNNSMVNSITPSWVL